MFIWLIVAIIASVIAHGQAKKKGYSAAAWALLCFLFPFLVLVILLFGPNKNAPLPDDNMKCPFCAEVIKKEAILCRFCGKDMTKKVETPIPNIIKETPYPDTSDLNVRWRL